MRREKRVFNLDRILSLKPVAEKAPDSRVKS
jgi:hypothetical protein